MNYRHLLLNMLLSCAAVVPAASSAQESIFGRTPPPAQAEAPPAEEGPPPPPQPQELLDLLDTRAKAAQLMMVSLQGLYGPSDTDARLLKEYTPGAVILRQLAHPQNAAKYVNSLRQAAAARGVPMLIGANLFALIQRDRNTPSEFIQLPSLLAISAAHDPEVTARLGHLLGEFMKALGLDFQFGPSLELAPQLADARGSIHDFGSDPRFAAEAGAAIVRALQERNVMTIPVGFPGGGANRDNRRAAVLLTPRPLLRETVLLPYTYTMTEGVRAVHVANTLVPTIDPAAPAASLSSAVLRDLLREELNFEGVVVAGPMDAEEIAGKLDVADAALLALRNGADMIYWRGAVDAAMRATDRVAKAVLDGDFPAELLDEKVRKVLALKSGESLVQREALKEKELSSLERNKKLIQESYEVERRSITLIQNRGQILPLSKASMPIALTGVVHLDNFQKSLEEIAKPISQQRITTALHMGDIEQFEIDRLTSRIRGIKTVVCVFTDDLRARGQIELVHALKEKGVSVVVVYLGYPQHVAHLTEADAIVLGYCNSSDYEQTLRAVADVLRGEAPVRIYPAEGVLQAKVGEVRAFNAYEVALAPAGRLPVKISDQFPAGFAVPYLPTKAIKKVQWDLGDGTRGKDPQISHAYTQPGSYTVSLTITDTRGETFSREFPLEVVP